MQQHRDALDVEEAPVMPRAILQPAQRQGRRSLLFRLSVAASVAACLALVVFAGLQWNDKAHNGLAINTGGSIVPVPKQPDIAVTAKIQPVSPNAENIKPATPVSDPAGNMKSLLNNVQETYGVMVNMQLSRIRSTAVLAENPDYFSAFRSMLNQADASETLIKRKIARSGITTELLEKLIDIYQQKLDILKNLRSEIDKMNEKAGGTPADSSLMKTYYINI